MSTQSNKLNNKLMAGGDFNPYYPMFHSTHYTGTAYDNSAKEKTMLQKLSATFKRVLNKDMQAQYRANLRNSELNLTDKGKKELLDILATKYEKELAERANEIIKELKEDK